MISESLEITSQSDLWPAERVKSALLEVTPLYPDVLKHVTQLLNQYHSFKNSTGYYDILLASWLTDFIHIAYAAFTSLQLDLKHEKGENLTIFPEQQSFMSGFMFEGLHQQKLKSIIGLFMNSTSKLETLKANDHVTINHGCFSAPSWRTRITKSLGTKNPKLLICLPYFAFFKNEWVKALFRWRKWVSWNDLDYNISMNVSINWKWRIKTMLEQCPANNFLSILKAILPLYIPAVFLEGFMEFRQKVLNWHLPRPQAVFSANALYYHHAFTILVAEWQKEGTMILYHQHGGGYGTDFFNSSEDIETRIADRFYTFGWRTGNKKVKPLGPPAILIPASKKSSTLLLICNEFPRFVYRLQFCPMPGTMETMIAQTCDFLKTLDTNIEIKVRPYPIDFGWGMMNAMRKANPCAKITGRVGGRPYHLYSNSDVVVHNYLGTSYLETLSLNMPTVCFYDPNAYCFRPEAQPFIYELLKVGILHQDGIAAAKFVRDIIRFPSDWWNKYDVQNARVSFVQRYANYTPNWRQLWEEEFLNVIS